MTEKITENEATLLAEWLGETCGHLVCDGSLGKVHLMGYLYSPEGQSTVIKKILETPRVKIILGGSIDQVDVEISYWDKEDGPYEYAETLEHALLLAVLEMIGGE